MGFQEDRKFLQRAVKLSKIGMDQGQGGPFGCVIVKDGQIIGEGYNRVIATNDPTAHGEVIAIRNACQNLKTFKLDQCHVFTSCEPCPMCFGAIYWSGATRVVFANTKVDAARIGFIDDFIYKQLEKTHEMKALDFMHHPLEQAIEVFNEWHRKKQKTQY